MGGGSTGLFTSISIYSQDNSLIPTNILKTKPKHSPIPEKWFKKGGKISIDKNNNWIYIDKNGNSVSYKDGYPNFKDANLIEQEIKLDKFNDYNKDFKEADDKAIKNGTPRDYENNTWHHHEDGTTMQEINKEIHKDFRHQGGMSNKE